jgi:hypothetical protein
MIFIFEYQCPVLPILGIAKKDHSGEKLKPTFLLTVRSY